MQGARLNFRRPECLRWGFTCFQQQIPVCFTTVACPERRRRYCERRRQKPLQSCQSFAHEPHDHTLRVWSSNFRCSNVLWNDRTRGSGCTRTRRTQKAFSMSSGRHSTPRQRSRNSSFVQKTQTELQQQGYSIWFAEYKHNEDYTKKLMASNLIGGFFQV